MKVANLFVSGFLGLQSCDVETQATVQLFAGRNGAGKSSLRDAVALALTADLGRVSLKKEAAQLIHTGADTAVCELRDADGDTYTVTINAAGKITDSFKGRETDPTLPYVLDAQRFARLDDKERRAFLYGLMGMKTDPAAVRARLIELGCDKARVERIAPLLRAGFEAASKDAKAKATEAKGAWRAITGETYGSEKAKLWRAAVPTYDAQAFKALTTDLQHCDVAAESWQMTIGKAQAEEQRRAELRAKLPALKEHAAKLQRITDKLTTDQVELARLAADLAAAQAAAGAGPRVGLVHDLAAAVHALLVLGTVDRDSVVGMDASKALATYEAQHGKVGATGGDAANRERLPALVEAHRLTTSAVANDERDLLAARQAKASADSIEAELAETFDVSELANAKEQADALKAQRAEIVKKLDVINTAKAAADAAEKKTGDAGVAAHDVAAWDAIGDALAPDGIPSEVLAKALGPINERLASSAADTQWPVVVIGTDMSVMFGDRNYHLVSESEKWRADAMVAEAIAFLSGVRLLVLDRVDVLDLQGRAELLAWLEVLAETGELDTALIFATLKALPADLPTTIQAHWIENGVVGQLKAAA
jgi:energy-coupling factor transporter ATP-binding protein EcfA2